VGSIYFAWVTELFLAQLPMTLTTGRDAVMQVTTDAAPLRRLQDVHFKPAGGETRMELYACYSHEGCCHLLVSGGFKR
jgi:hypothetical protein